MAPDPAWQSLAVLPLGRKPVTGALRGEKIRLIGLFC